MQLPVCSDKKVGNNVASAEGGSNSAPSRLSERYLFHELTPGPNGTRHFQCIEIEAVRNLNGAWFSRHLSPGSEDAGSLTDPDGKILTRYRHIFNLVTRPGRGRKLGRWVAQLQFAKSFLFLLLLILTPALGAAPKSANTSPFIVPFRFLKGFAVIVPVYLNGSGPFDFLLDTGSSCTSVDSDLAMSLKFPAHGRGTVTTLVRELATSLTTADTVSVGPVTEANVMMIVSDLDGLHHLDPRIRGVLGQDVLKHADYLLDYQHHQIEFENAGRLLSSLSGERIPLLRVPALDNADYFLMVIRTEVVDRGVLARSLLLDSGSASLVLFTDRVSSNPARPLGAVQDVSGQQLAVSVAPVQLRLGGRSWEVAANTIFFSAQVPGFDSLLPTSLFTQLYISQSGTFILLNPRRQKRTYSSSTSMVLLHSDPAAGCKQPFKLCEKTFAESAANHFGK